MPTVINTLEAHEELLLLTYLKDHWQTGEQRKKAIRNHCIALLMLDTGIRVGELVQLRIGQLYYAGCPCGALHIEPKQAKRNSERIIPITERLEESLRQMYDNLWKHREHDLNKSAFSHAYQNRTITPRQIQRIIGNASLKCLARKIHPHVLRHTFATKLMRTCSIRVVQQLLGHRSIQSTQIYTHPNSVDLQKAIDTLNQTSQQNSQNT